MNDESVMKHPLPHSKMRSKPAACCWFVQLIAYICVATDNSTTNE